MRVSDTARPFPRDALILLAIAAVCAGGIYPEEGHTIVTWLWPVICIILLTVLGLARLVLGLRERATAPAGEEEDTDLASRLWFIVLYFLYILAMQWFGFYIGTPLFLALFIYRLNIDRPLPSRTKRALGIMAVMLLVITLLFLYVFNLNVPMGEGMFRLLNERIVYLPYAFGM